MPLTMPRPTPEDREEFSEADIAALDRALELYLTRDGSAEQVERGIAQGDSWRELVWVACLSEQSDELDLSAGAFPPYWQRNNAKPYSHRPNDVRAFQILEEMRKYGVSPFDPSPIRAVEQAKRAV